MKIRTEYWAKPIPDRRWDWSAVDDETYEGGGPIGFGPTEEAAIADLMEEIELRHGLQDFANRMERDL